MTNLLPTDTQNDVRRFYSLRRRIAMYSAMIVVAMLSLLALVPGFLLLHTVQSETQTDTALQHTQDDNAVIAHANDLLVALSPLVAASSSVSEAVSSALALRNGENDVTIDRISYQSDTRGRIILSGAASKSRDIDAYRRALSLDPHFAEVSVPIGALVGARNSGFSITLSGSF